MLLGPCSNPCLTLDHSKQEVCGKGWTDHRLLEFDLLTISIYLKDILTMITRVTGMLNKNLRPTK